MATIRSSLESLFWVLAAAVVVFYGSGQYDLITVIMYDKRLHRTAVNFGLINVAINVMLFAYVAFWLRWVRGVRDPFSTDTLAIPMGAVTMASSIVAFIVGLWPVFGVLAIVQVVVLAYGVVSGLALIPALGVLKAPQQDDPEARMRERARRMVRGKAEKQQ